MNSVVGELSVQDLNNFSEDSRDKKYIVEQTKQIYAGNYNAVLATLINAPILVFVLWPVINHRLLLTWIGVVATISLFRFLNIYLYKKSTPDTKYPRYWLHRYILFSFLMAMAWASAAVWLFPEADTARQTFLAFVIGGMCAGAVTNMSHSRVAIYSFLVMSLGPLIIKFINSDTQLSISMAGMTSLYLLMLALAAKRAHANINENIKLGLEVHDKELSLKSSEQKYKTLLECATDAFILHDLEGRIYDVNQQACANLGYSRDELLAMSVSEIEIGKNEKDLDKIWERILKGESMHVEGRHRRKDNSTFPVEVSVGLVNVSGRDLVMAFIRDISDRKIIEQERIQFDKILDESWNEIYMFDADSLRFTKISKGGVINLGYDEGELRKIRPFDIKPAFDEQAFREILQPLIDGKENIVSFMTVHQRKDGSSYPVDIRIQLINNESNPFYVAIVQDITEQLFAEKQILELAKFPEEAANPILKVDSEGIIRYANPASKVIREFWSVEAGDKVPDDLSQMIDRTIQSKVSQEYTVSCNDRIFNMQLAPVTELDAVYIYSVDVTQQKHDQAELRQHKSKLEDIVASRTNELLEANKKANEASKAKSRFLSNMSHEIRTPLSTILGFAEILQDGEKIDRHQEKAISAIFSSGHHLQNIVNDVLDLSKIEANKMDVEQIPVNLKDLIHEIEILVRPQANARELDLVVKRLNDVPEFIVGDPLKIKQILLNLASNAIKFTERGQVTINISLYDNGKRIHFSVSDTGIGLTREQMDKLFQAFSQADTSTTRKYGGTGLGLVLSSQLAELLGGSLEVSSQYGQGSCFTLILPVGNVSGLSDAGKAVVKEKVQNAEMVKLQGRVLLVEDTPPMQELISFHITNMGLEYDIAENGQLALECVENNEYDLILMDMQMPVMDGVETTERLRAGGFTRPIVALTANVLNNERNRSMQAGCNDFVTKPVSRQRLYEVVKHYIQA